MNNQNQISKHQINEQNESDMANTSNSLDCSKLSEGMVVKNYKEMCTLLNESVMEGNSKKYQLKKWQCYFDYDKQGQKFIINEIFDEPYPNLDARKQKEGVYVKYIELLLMEYLMKQDGKEASLTKSKLYEMLGMISPDFYTYRRNRYMLSGVVQKKIDTLNPSKEQLKIFYQRADQKLNSILTSALRSMANRFLIHYQTEYIISENLDMGDNVFEKVERVATNSEISKILDVQHTVMCDMGYASMSDIFIHGKMKDFFHNVDEYVMEKYEWNYVYSHIRIIYLENEIKRQIPIKAEEIRKLSTEHKRIGLNNTVVDSLNMQLQKKYEKMQAEYDEIEMLIGDTNNTPNNSNADDDWGENNPMDNPTSENTNNAIVYSQDFVDIQKQLTDYLIKLKK